MDSKQGLKRTLSSSNINAAEQIHNFIKIQQDALKDQIPQLNRDVTKSSMILPEQYSAETLRLCVDLKHLNELEEEHYLNWCTDCRLLLPLEVEADGNSLLHSLSLYMFGVQDKRYVLRQLLYQRLFMEPHKGLLKQRWTVKNSTRSGVTWNNVVEMASDKVLSSRNNFANVTSIHIFTMANILARPIIVLCGSEVQHKELPVGGIYLPLLRSSLECEKSPIILGYKNGHFVPLISSENLNIPLCKRMPSEDALHCIPLVDYCFKDLHLKFLLPNEDLGDNPGNIRNMYLDVITISNRIGKNQTVIAAAMLKFKTPPAFSIELMWSLDQLTKTSYQPPISALHAENRNEGIYTDVDNIDVDNSIYESLIPCAEQVNGCRNNASSNNQKDLCQDCYETFVAQQNATVMCSRKILGCDNFAEKNSQGMCAFCYQAFVSVSEQNATRKHANQEPIIKCATPSCKDVRLTGLNGKCRNCFKLEYEDKNYGDHAVGVNNVGDNTYDILNTDENNYDVGCDYDQLNRGNVNKNRPLPTPRNEDTKLKYYDQSHTFTGQLSAVNMGMPSGQVNNDNRQGANQYGMDNRREHLTNTNNDTVQDGLPAYPIATSNVTNLQGATAAYTRDVGPTDSVRTKVLCDIAGCTNSIGPCGKHCDMHNPQVQQPKFKTCIMKGCSNTAEFNDNYLCMICFQSQKHVVRESIVLDRTGLNPMSGGAFIFKSIADELPPIPMPSPNFVESTVKPRFTTNPRFPCRPQMGYQNMNSADNIQPIPTDNPQFPCRPQMGYQNMNNADNIQPQMGYQNRNSAGNIPNFAQNIPNIPSTLGMSPNIQGPAFIGRPQFIPPMAYGGFEGFNKQFATQNATLNWQKGGMGMKEFNDPKKCVHCDNHSNPARGGLCNECHRQKEEGINQGQVKHDELIKCINDGCKEAGMERFNFLCDSCYQKQLQAMKPDVEQKQQEQMPVRSMDKPLHYGGFPAGNINNPQMQQGGVNNPYRFNTNNELQQPQFHHGDMGGNIYGGNIGGGQGNYKMVSTSTANPSSTTVNPIGANVNPVYHNSQPPANEGKQNCKGLSCEYFGSEEFGGYCSGCFLNITKKEAVKQDTIRTYAPPDMDAAPPTPNQATSLRCRVNECQNYGSNQRMGYCSKCAQIYGDTE